jgi:hypothetical protein
MSHRRGQEDTEMAKFITIGYGDEAGYNRTEPALRDAAHEHDARLQAGGSLMGIAGKPVQVRNHSSRGVQVLKEAYMRSELPVAGFALIDAASIEEAIDLVSRTPCAVAYGVVEVWPLLESPA